MDFTYGTIGQWYKHLVTISKERFDKDASELTDQELREASQLIKDFNKY